MRIANNVKKISTVAQFKVRDYGMEQCFLKIVLPRNLSISPSNESPSEPRKRNWIMFTEAMNIEIWSLKTPHSENIKKSQWIDPRTLSSGNRPPREKKVAELSVFAGSEARSESFGCLRDSVLSFELACDDCTLDVWQDKQKPPIGLVIEQHASL
jgi:hypothetical protein